MDAGQPYTIVLPQATEGWPGQRYTQYAQVPGLRG
jgi:hypothetical protein